jgi:hypothetical protein
MADAIVGSTTTWFLTMTDIAFAKFSLGILLIT